MCNLSADDWYFLESKSFINSSGDCPWPWLNLNRKDWYYFTSITERVSYISKQSRIVNLIAIPLGLFSSLLILITLSRKVFKEKERFYIWMFAIASFDLLFNLLLTWFYAYNNTTMYLHSHLGTLIPKCFESCAYGLSLSGDLCSLILTIERYCAICKAAATPNNVKPFYTAMAVGVIFIGFSMRVVRYSVNLNLVQQDVSKGTIAAYGYAWSTVADTIGFKCLAFASDNLLPFAMLILMIYFSLRIASVVYKRKKSKVVDNSIRSQQQKQVQERSSAMLRLVFVLVFLFVLNQFGYCFYAVMFLVRRSSTISFSSFYDEVMSSLKILIIFKFSVFILNLFECLSRSLNFYFYYVYSASIRNEFKKLWRKSEDRSSSQRT